MEVKALDANGGPEPGSDQYDSAYSAINQKYQPQINDVRNQMNGTTNIKHYIDSIPGKCRAFPYSFWADFFSNNGNNFEAMISDGIEKTYTGKMAMVKTDNGWPLDR